MPKLSKKQMANLAVFADYCERFGKGSERKAYSPSQKAEVAAKCKADYWYMIKTLFPSLALRDPDKHHIDPDFRASLPTKAAKEEYDTWILPPWFHLAYNKLFFSSGNIRIGLPWARGFSKTGCTQLNLIQAILRGERVNCLYMSHEKAMVTQNFFPFFLNEFANNQLLQELFAIKPTAKWAEDLFVVNAYGERCMFKAVGYRTTIRGTKQDSFRPNNIVFDDYDDESTLSKELVDKKYNKLMGQAIGALESGWGRVIGLGNYIGHDTVMTRFCAMEQTQVIHVNIWDADGNPSWPQKNSKKQVYDMFHSIPYARAMIEYFNSPVPEGTVFESNWLQYTPMDDLYRYDHIMCYGDPGYTNGKGGDFKAWVVVGRAPQMEGPPHYHVLDAYVELSDHISWASYPYNYWQNLPVAIRDKFTAQIEDAFNQTELLNTTFTPLAQKLEVPQIVQPSYRRQKRNKQQRILEMQSYFQLKQIYFNSKFLDDDGNLIAGSYERLVYQLLAFDPSKRNQKDDGPDALAGAIENLEFGGGSWAAMPKRANTIANNQKSIKTLRSNLI